MTLTANQLHQLKEALIGLEIQLKKDIEEASEASKPVELDQTAFGRVSRIDAIQQQQMQLASLNRMKQRLITVQSALSRVDDKDFGLCKVCEEPISFERLKARPESTVCLSCAQG